MHFSELSLRAGVPTCVSQTPCSLPPPGAQLLLAHFSTPPHVSSPLQEAPRTWASGLESLGGGQGLALCTPKTKQQREAELSKGLPSVCLPGEHAGQGQRARPHPRLHSSQVCPLGSRGRHRAPALCLPTAPGSDLTSQQQFLWPTAFLLKHTFL